MTDTTSMLPQSAQSSETDKVKHGQNTADIIEESTKLLDNITDIVQSSDASIKFYEDFYKRRSADINLLIVKSGEYVLGFIESTVHPYKYAVQLADYKKFYIYRCDILNMPSNNTVYYSHNKLPDMYGTNIIELDIRINSYCNMSIWLRGAAFRLITFNKHQMPLDLFTKVKHALHNAPCHIYCVNAASLQLVESITRDLKAGDGINRAYYATTAQYAAFCSLIGFNNIIASLSLATARPLAAAAQQLPIKDLETLDSETTCDLTILHAIVDTHHIVRSIDGVVLYVPPELALEYCKFIIMRNVFASLKLIS
jgi:hypothetical protein